MALTVNFTGPNAGAPVIVADCKINFADITCDSSYPTGGYLLTANNVGFNTVIYAVSVSESPSGYLPCWNNTTQKLQLLQGTASGPLGEPPNTTDVHTVTFRVIFWGT